MRRFAKRSVLAPILLLALSGVPTAGHADTATTTVKGSIKVMWDDLALHVGIPTATEAEWIAGGCAEQPSTFDEGGIQGLDAFVIKLPVGSAGQRIEEVYRKGVANQDPVGAILVVPDIDYYFFGADCAFIDDSSMATAALEKSTVPEGAEWVVGYLFAGDPVHFTIEIDHDVAP